MTGREGERERERERERETDRETERERESYNTKQTITSPTNRFLIHLNTTASRATQCLPYTHNYTMNTFCNDTETAQ